MHPERTTVRNLQRLICVNRIGWSTSSFPGDIIVQPRSVRSATGCPGFPTLWAVDVFMVAYSLAPSTT